MVRLGEVEALFASGDLIVDGCRRMVRGPARTVRLAGRPVLYELISALAEAWPADVPRNQLIERTFLARAVNESHRVRLRVELSRLRAVLRPLARIKATARGFALSPTNSRAVVVLAPPVDGPAGSIIALLEGGESWSTSALACALGSSQRSVQRALRQLEEAEAVRAVGRGRSRRWLAPALGGFATTLLLPGALAVG
jgi:DNA-binding transcriptional ArsR family regulator